MGVGYSGKKGEGSSQGTYIMHPGTKTMGQGDWEGLNVGGGGGQGRESNGGRE